MTKIKGISIWEQYVEHIVLGVAVVAALALTALQFVGQPNAVQHAGHGQVSPAQVDNLLRAEAERVSRLLSSPVSEEFSDPAPLLPLFERTLAGSISPAPQIGPTHIHIAMGIGEWMRPEVTYIVPQLPAARDIVAMQYHDTLTDEAVKENELSELFPAAPYDLGWVTSGGVLNLNKILEQFKSGEDNGGPAPIPSSWYGDRPLVLNIVMEREQYLDGVWGNAERIDPIPGQFHLLDLLAQEVESSRRDEIIRLARDDGAQSQLIQPAFYETKGGAWSPPDPYDAVAETGDPMAQVRRLVQRRNGFKRDREDYLRRIERLEEGHGEGGGRRPGGGIGGGGGGMGGGGMGGMGGGGGGGELGGGGAPGGGVGGGGGPDHTRQLENLRRLLAEVEGRIEQTNREIERLTPAGMSLPTVPEGEMIFWAHDISVEPGRTYRYRFIVEVYNPFCARKLNLLEDQHFLAESFTLATEPSEWSSPIHVQPPIQMFVVEAHQPRPHRGPGLSRPLGSAKIEIWRFYDGNWRQREITIEPGERVAATGPDRRGGEDAVEIDFLTDWYVLDIVPDADALVTDIRAARVILQNVRTGEVLERHPLWDAPGRNDLRSRAQRVAGGT